MTKPSPQCSPRKTSKRAKPKRITYAGRVRTAYQYGLVFDRFHVDRPPRKELS